MAFTQQKLFEAAWKELYPGMIERIARAWGRKAAASRPVESRDQHHRHRFPDTNTAPGRKS